MITVDSRPPERGRTITGRIGRRGIMLLVLLLMVAIVVGLNNLVGDDAAAVAEPSEPSESSSVEPDEAGSGALAQAPTPTVPPKTATAAPTATSSPTPTPSFTPTAEPTETPPPTAFPTTLPNLKPTLAPESVAKPLPMPTPRDIYSWTLEVPILMYHYISEPPEESDKYRLDLSTSPAAFREQMSFLVNDGYETVDLYDLTLAIVGKGELPAKPVIITLDDGYRDNYENAFPILQELGLTATFFVTTEFVDLGNPAYMDWPMIEEMAAAGMRIEPHSKTHPDLTVHDRDYIIWEVLGSQETIASHTGQRPRYFAYPGGRYNDEIIQIVSELDFWGAVTTASGSWHGFEDRFEWGRVRMRYTTSLAEMADLIE